MTINDFERARSVVITNLYKKLPEDTITEDEFNDLLADPENFRYVNWSDREDFLRANGYALNRANMVDSNLSSKQGEKR